MTRPLLFALSFAVLLVTLLAFATRAREPVSREVSRIPSSVTVPEADRDRLGEVEALRDPRRAAGSRPEPQPADPRDSLDAVGALVADGSAAPRLLLRVLLESTGEPLPEAEIVLAPAGHRPYHAITDARGEFEVGIAAVPAQYGDAAPVRVRDRDGLERWRGTITLAAEVTLRVPDALVLRGEVALASGASSAGLTVSAWRPPRGAETVETFIGHDELGLDGRFAIAAPAVDAPAAFTLRVGGVGIPACRRVPTAELVSPAGARVVVALAQLVVEVADDAGTPLVRAAVRCVAPASTDGSEPLVAQASTGADGRARFAVPASDVSVNAGSDGHAPARLDVRAIALDAPVRLVLRRLRADEHVRGAVAFEDGTPAVAALVSAWDAADEGELAVTSMVQARADPEGEFDVPLPNDRPLVLYAFHKDHGESGEVAWRPGDAPPRLVIDRGTTVIVGAERKPSVPPNVTARYDVVLVRSDGRVESVEADRLPVTLERVSAGSWRVFAAFDPLGSTAEAAIVVTAGQPARVDLVFDAEAHLSGRVTPAPDPLRGLAVRFVPDGWPPAAARVLSVGVREDGTFRVPARGFGTAELVEGPRTIERRPARGGATLVFTLPE